MLGRLVHSQYPTLELINIVTSIISLVSIVIVLVVIVSIGVFGYRKKKVALFHSISFNKLSFCIIFFIFVSDLFRMIGHVLPVPSSSLPSIYSALSCRPGAFFKLFGSIATFVWMNITSYIVYRLLLYPHKFDKAYVERIKRIFHCISWPVALLISMIPLALRQYTMERSDGPWCFIDTHSADGLGLALMCYYLWLFGCWFTIVIVYVMIGKLLINDYKKAKDYNNDLINIINHNNIITKVPTIQRLQYFPLVFLFCWFWEILSLSYRYLHSDDLFVIKCMQSVFVNLYGLFNALLFVYIIRNFNSNSVVHRNPSTIGFRRNAKRKRKRKSTHSSNKRRKSENNDVHEEEHEEEDYEEGGVVVTHTTRNMRLSSLSVEEKDVDMEETVSLGVGNISVMSPTSTSIAKQVQMDIDKYDTSEDMSPLSLHNVTIGYNEDASDEVYSDVTCTEHGVMLDDDETKTASPFDEPKDILHTVWNQSKTKLQRYSRVNTNDCDHPQMQAEQSKLDSS